MKTWLRPLIGWALALAITGAIIGFSLANGGTDTPEQDPAVQVDDSVGDQPPVRSDEGIDPDECNLVHNITACDGNPTLEDPPLPTYEDWVRDYGTDDEGNSLRPVRSDEGIDPNECNWVHNITACDADEFGGDPQPESGVVSYPTPDLDSTDGFQGEDQPSGAN